MLASCLAFRSNLKDSSDESVDFNRAARRYVPEGVTPHIDQFHICFDFIFILSLFVCHLNIF
jgi:hypothetical protein